MKKKSIMLGKYEVVLRDPDMTYDDARDALEAYLLETLLTSVGGKMLLRLYFYFDTETRPLSAIEFFEFWDDLSDDPWAILPYMLFAENELAPSMQEMIR
jgi:hypothetical protein